MASIRSFVVAATFLGTALSAFGHSPDQPKHRIAELGKMEFENGGSIGDLRISYVTHGKLSANKDNAILLLHGFGANHHGFDAWIGPGRAFDTNKYFIIVPDQFGNTQVGFEHSTGPTNSGLGMNFPPFNARDMVKTKYRLVAEVLGIKRVVAIAGISNGAAQAVQFAVSHPDFAERIIPIAGGALWGTQGMFFMSQLQSIIENCDGWQNGQYKTNPGKCAANAVSALVPYFYSREWWEENIASPDAYSQWRKAWGEGYLDVQEARDLYLLSKAMTRSWLGDTPGFNGDVSAALKAVKAKALFLVSPYDQFFLPKHIETQRRLIPNARVASIDSTAGHLICCGGDAHATWLMGEAMRGFLSER